MGVVKQVPNGLISSIDLESGNKLYWCDKTINNIIKRVKEVKNENRS